MNTRGTTRHPFTILLIACAFFTLLLSACQTANGTTSLEQAPTTAPALPTQAAAEATQHPDLPSDDITLDLSGMALDQTIETVAAVPASADTPGWAAAPEYRSIALQGYPVTGSAVKPQIFIYPAAELASANENMGKVAADLQALLKTEQAGENLPFLPLVSAAQMMHAQVQYLDFKNGNGVRYLTQYSQGIYPINNVMLSYTFQGLTSDGKYYIAAVLPVTNPELQDTDQVSSVVGDEYQASLAKTVAMLDQQPGASFTPDLAKLDALIQSIEVK